MVLHCDSCCQVHLRLRRCTATASAVDTDFVPRAYVAGRSMVDVTSASDSRRVRMPTCALWHTAAIVLTAFCAPVLQMPAERRPAMLTRPTGSCRARESSPLQRGERCCQALPSCCGGGFKLALPSPLCFCSMQTCMSKTLCMCFAGAVCVMSVSSRTGEKPVWLARTSFKWVLCERIMETHAVGRIDVDEMRDCARFCEM